MTNHDGKLVQLESGAWAQYRRIAVQGPMGQTMLIAVELTEAELQALLPAAPSAPQPTLH